MNITRAAFIASFAAALAAVQAAERVTKEQLRVLSRDLLGALHGAEEFEATLAGDIQFINQLIPALTPMNRKTFILFCNEFTGFHFDDSTGEYGEYTKKIQKGKAETREKALKFLADPLNNLWSWAERHVKVEKKPFSLSKLTAMVEKAREETGGDDEAVMRAIFEGGMSIESVLLVMEEMGKEAKKEEEQQPQE